MRVVPARRKERHVWATVGWLAGVSHVAIARTFRSWREGEGHRGVHIRSVAARRVPTIPSARPPFLLYFHSRGAVFAVLGETRNISRGAKDVFFIFQHSTFFFKRKSGFYSSGIVVQSADTNSEALSVTRRNQQAVLPLERSILV